MPSIHPDYEYDIFISYRHNDNKRDGWVTSFVEALRGELEATLKTPISIYFDENPHDGLLDTHQVDASLAKKLKCLVFLPIISQTYCDETSFAWEHELLPFVKMAKEDEIGMNMTLSNGNVVSRVLPVKIHRLDSDDQNALEAVLDGPLRSIDFIYQEAGVNRPLLPTDKRELNLEKTDYRNQMNKVANALKDIGQSMVKKADGKINVPVGSSEEQSAKRASGKGIYLGLAAIAIALLLFWGYTKFYNSPAVQDGDVTIAVLAFDDQSPNGDQEWLGDGMADEILNVLAQVNGLQVTGKTSSFSFKGKNATIKEIGEALNVKTVLEGSVVKVGNKLRITAQLIDVETDKHIWSNKYDRDASDILGIIDEVSQSIAGALKIELSIENISIDYKVDIEAYNYYLQARYVSEALVWGGSMKKEDFKEAERLYLKSIDIDSTFAMSHAGLGHLYAIYESLIYRYEETANNKTLYIDKAKSEIAVAYEQNPSSDYVNAVMGYIYEIDTNPAIGIEKAIAAVKLNPENSLNWNILGLNYYYGFGLDNLGSEMYDYSIKLDPLNAGSLWALAMVAQETGKLSQAEKYVNEGLKISPNHLGLLIEQVRLSVMVHDLETARSALDKAEFINAEFSWLTTVKAYYYAALGEKDEALRYSKNSTTYLLLNMNEEAMQQLVKGFQEPSLRSSYLWLNNYPILKPLRADPRFINILKQEKEIYDRNMRLYEAKADELRSLMTRK